VKKKDPEKKIESEDKLSILETLQNKSAREGQKILIKLQPSLALPKEKERVITESHTEVRFIMTAELRSKLEVLRSLLGSKGAHMSFAELIEYMVAQNIQDLKVKKFGRKRVSTENQHLNPLPRTDVTPTAELHRSSYLNPRYIPRKVRHPVWDRDKGKCQKCDSRNHLNFDHIRPVALGGLSQLDNLRLLCFHCNQRHAFKNFGPRPTRNF